MLKRTEKYTLVGSPASLIEQLERIQRQDKRAEGKARQASGLGCLGALLSFFGLPMLVPGEGAVPAAILGTIGSLVGAWTYHSRWARHDLDDTKLAVARHLLQQLQVDLRDTVQAHLTLDFREPLSGPFTTRTEGLKRYYRQTWLELSTVLADSTRLELEVTRQGRHREKFKRKTANKVRHVRTDRISVALRVDPARYPDLSGVDLGQPPRDLVKRGVRAQKDRLQAVATTPAAIHDNVKGIVDRPELLANAERILGALAWAYRGMKVVKTANVR